jgi:DNA invertase Pin-like site-specific DNA recombinase
LSEALDRLETGDVLTVWKLDRLGRNTRHVLDVIEDIRERGSGFRSLTEGLDTTGPMGTAMLTIVAAFAQLERDTMIERTRAGLAAAAAKNRHGGRPRKDPVGLGSDEARDVRGTIDNPQDYPSSDHYQDEDDAQHDQGNEFTVPEAWFAFW